MGDVMDDCQELADAKIRVSTIFKHSTSGVSSAFSKAKSKVIHKEAQDLSIDNEVLKLALMIQVYHTHDIAHENKQIESLIDTIANDKESIRKLELINYSLVLKLRQSTTF